MRPPSEGGVGSIFHDMTVVKGPSGAARTGQLASTIGWRVGCQVHPPVGIGHPGRPISSPRVKKTSCWRIRSTEKRIESSATPASTAAILAWL